MEISIGISILTKLSNISQNKFNKIFKKSYAGNILFDLQERCDIFCAFCNKLSTFIMLTLIWHSNENQMRFNWWIIVNTSQIKFHENINVHDMNDMDVLCYCVWDGYFCDFIYRISIIFCYWQISQMDFKSISNYFQINLVQSSYIWIIWYVCSMLLHWDETITRYYCYIIL